VRFPLLSFSRRVLGSFRRNQGLLLAGAVAYYTLLSLVPLLIVLLVALSHFVERQRLLDALTTNLDFLVPGQTRTILAQVESFRENRQVIGVVGLGGLLFFSAMAFGVLENAVAMIFHHRVKVGSKVRHFLVSAVMPYLFVMALAAGLLLVTLITGGLEAVGRRSVHVAGHVWSLAPLTRALVYALGMAGSILLLTALYMIMPVGRLAFRRALMGALAATILWEGVRRLLFWYFTHLSIVNVVYGSVATTVIFLLTLEAGSVIFLLGAQVIAELEAKTTDGATAAPQA
jgi:membrane protein